MKDEIVLSGEIVDENEPSAPEDSWDLSRSNGQSAHPVLIYLSSLPSDKSKSTQRSGLAAILSSAYAKKPLGDLMETDRIKYNEMVFTFPWWELNRESYEALIVALVNRNYAPAAIQRMISGLNKTLKKCTLKEKGDPYFMSMGDYARVTDPDGRPKFGKSSETGRRVTAEEQASLYAACEVRRYAPPRNDEFYRENESITLRDKALLACCFIIGLRVDEVCKLRLSNIQRSSKRLAVSGKTGNAVIPLPAMALQLIDDWLKVRGNEKGYIFCRVDWTGEIHKARKVNHLTCSHFDKDGNQIGCGFDFSEAVEEHRKRTGRSYHRKNCPDCGLERPYDLKRTQMRPGSLQDILQRRAEIAGIDPVTWHDGRRSMISAYLDAGDAKTAQRLARHKNIATTYSYERFTDARYEKSLSNMDEQQAKIIGVKLRDEYKNGDKSD